MNDSIMAVASFQGPMVTDQTSIRAFINILLALLVSFSAAPCAAFLVVQTVIRQNYYVSLQVRVQICAWMAVLCSLCIMGFYLVFSWNQGAPVYNPNAVFVMCLAYMVSGHACAMSVLFMLVDRCVALLSPRRYTQSNRLRIMWTCCTAMFCWAAFVFFRVWVFDFPLVDENTCPHVACMFKTSIEIFLRFRSLLTALNFFLALVFAILLVKYNRHHQNQLPAAFSNYSRRTNIIALWSVGTELFFNMIPLFSLFLVYYFDVHILQFTAQFVLSGIAFDGFFTVLLYLKIVVLKQQRGNTNTIQTLQTDHHW